jgi:cytochrome c553
MREPGMYAWRNPWFRWSVVSVFAIAVFSLLVGFVWLPSVHADFSAQGLWASICRAAGVPDRWSDPAVASKADSRSTRVVLEPAMGRQGSREGLGRGATVAVQQCTMCHGAEGITAADAPNLAGQYPEVLIKQLLDYRSGDRRSSTVMQALAASLSDGAIEDLAAYYASLPKARTTPVPPRETAPALVRVGDPLRNIAPCASCHGGIDRKLGAPWLEGMPRQYLADQLTAFATGTRRNDSHAQMRNMARYMTATEIDEVADFYARRGGEAGVRAGEGGPK